MLTQLTMKLGFKYTSKLVNSLSSDRNNTTSNEISFKPKQIIARNLFFQEQNTFR